MVAYQIPKLPDFLRRNKAAVDEIVLKTVRYPLGVALVSFLAFDRFRIFRMGKNEIAGWFKHIPDGNPVFPCGFHADIAAILLIEPISKAT